MVKYQFTRLKIDREFRNLIPTLAADEYRQLEENLRKEGCHEPIYTWDGVIIDGHKRYEICVKLRIPFTTRQLDLSDKHEAMAWICANQIDQRIITNETRRYLIGKRYELEKDRGSRYCLERKHCTCNSETAHTIGHDAPSDITKHETARRLGFQYCLSHATIVKYGAYARAIDHLIQKDERLARRILSGQTKIAHDNLIELSKLSVLELQPVSKRLIRNDRNFIGYATAQKNIRAHAQRSKSAPDLITETTVKDMPAFDPDAEIASLILTIPSWISLMERSQSAVSFHLVSRESKCSLIITLRRLKEAILIMENILKE